MTKKQAPTKAAIPFDRHDCLGTSPYTKREVLEGKIWQGTYAMEDRSKIDAKAKKASATMGTDFGNPETHKKVLAGAASDGERAVEVAKKDLEKLMVWWNKKEWTMEERFDPPPSKVNSTIVRLKSGGLLLYAPSRIREEDGYAAWLDGLGKVEWIVIGSSFHTLSLPNVLARYPEAKVIGAPQAEDKLNYINALVRGKFDFNASNKEELAAANKELEEEEVKLFFVYGRSDGGFLSISKEEFQEFKDEHLSLRLFKYLICNKPNSPNGYLATYRFMMMDHTGIAQIMYEPPKTDGSTCTLMADSLRKALALPFSTALGVHFDQLTREEFRATINCNWNWLDGTSLL